MTKEENAKEREKPPARYSLNSWRFHMSLLILFALFTRTSLRVDMSMAAVCMVNSSYSEETNVLLNDTEESSKCGHLTQEEASESGYNGDLPWTQTQVNRLFSANFYGILTSVWITGYISGKFDPKYVILVATTNSIIITLLTPTLSNISIWAVFGGRYVMGLLDGFIIPAIFSIASKWFPHNEVGSFAAIYTSGEQLGVVLTMPISSFLCASETLGWPSIFYFFGMLGCLFMVLWFLFATGSPDQNKYISELEKKYLQESIGMFHKKKPKGNAYKLILTSRAFWVAAISQISFAFSVVLMQVYLPLFLKQVLKVSLKKNGLLGLLPFLTQMFMKNTTGNIGDFFKKRGLLTNTQAVRIFQVFGNIGTATCFLILALFIDCDTASLAIVVLAIYGCFVSCGVLGFYTAYLSIAPRFSNNVSAISLLIGSLTHASVPSLMGFLNKNGTRAEWRNIWLAAVGLHCVSAVVFGIFGSADVQPWAKCDLPLDKKETHKLKEAEEELDELQGQCFNIPGFVNGLSMREHLEMMLYPEIAAADCSTVKESYIDAKVDNFDPSNTDTWKQRYRVNDKYFNASASNPIVFLHISGEETAVHQWVCWDNYTFMTFAKKYNALVTQLEHRFFGLSYPKVTKDGLGNMSLEALQFLSAQQAVADLANFVQNFQYQGKRIDNARWVAIGGSYPGALCAWFRAQYPNLTIGGVCSSAPLWPKTDFYEFAGVLEATITDWNSTCADNIRAGFAELRQMVYTVDGRNHLNALFNITPPLDPDKSTDFDLDATNFFVTVFTSFHRVIEYTFDARNNLTIHGFGVNSLCNIANQPLNDGETDVTRIKNIFFWVMTTEYKDYSYAINNQYSHAIGGFQRTIFDFHNGTDRGFAAGRGWMWISCGMAMGWLQTTDNGYSIFNRIIPLSYYMKQCRDIFGPTIDTTYITNKVAETAAHFKFPWNYTVTNTVLPNGQYDPWHALGSYVNNTDRHQVSILIPRAGHCSDMYPKRDDEPPGLSAARALIESEVDYYIRTSLESPSSTATTPNNKSASISRKVMSFELLVILFVLRSILSLFNL